uniref:Uncharacterized protein n=1 Tax=Meloidogyne enterolobii TaxID=390850 RepID=A0A6V7UZW5_MELEN|nr:unnamed protein product [Meloidogyne enterolobii]
MSLYKYDFEKLDNAGNFDLKSNNNYFDALKNYIEKLRMLYNHYFSIFDNPDVSKGDNIRLSEVHNALQDTREKVTEMQQSHDQRNQTLSDFYAAIEENKIKLSEMKELLIQGQKLNEKNTVSQQFFNNL